MSMPWAGRNSRSRSLGIDTGFEGVSNQRDFVLLQRELVAGRDLLSA